VTLTTSLFLELSILLHNSSLSYLNQPTAIHHGVYDLHRSKRGIQPCLNTVLDRGNSSSLKRSLIEDGITDIFDLITLMDDVIDSLAYKDPNDKIFHPVKKGDNMFLRCFLSYPQSLEPATDNVDYQAITQANFDSYCTRSLRTTILSLPRPRLNHLVSSLTTPHQNLVMGHGMALLNPLSFTGKIKYISMRNLFLQLIISQMVRKVSCFKTLSMVLMNFVKPRILLAEFTIYKNKYYLGN
jgi:hypothetical protein